MPKAQCTVQAPPGGIHREVVAEEVGAADCELQAVVQLSVLAPAAAEAQKLVVAHTVTRPHLGPAQLTVSCLGRAHSNCPLPHGHDKDNYQTTISMEEVQLSSEEKSFSI